MMDMDTEIMDAYYPGLSAVSTAQFVGKIAMITASANELVLIEVRQRRRCGHRAGHT